MVLLFVAIYALFRVVEAWGLWHAREWAEWFGILNGVLYLPIEVIELHHRYTALKLSVLLINLVVVAYLGWELRKTRLQKSHAHSSDPAGSLGQRTVTKKEKPGLSTGL
jgi:uncharacterized membrane protein (DUF2068 family)